MTAVVRLVDKNALIAGLVARRDVLVRKGAIELTPLVSPKTAGLGLIGRF